MSSAGSDGHQAIPGPAAPPRAWVTGGILGVLMVVGLLTTSGVRWWPFTTWELFSRIRSDTAVTWELRAGERSGRKRLIDTDELDPSMRAWLHVAKQLGAMAPAARRRVCGAWLEPMAARTPEVTALEVVRVTTRYRVHGGVVEPRPVAERIVVGCRR